MTDDGRLLALLATLGLAGAAALRSGGSRSTHASLTGKTVVLLSCTKDKDPRATTARALYQPSALFREGIAYAERRGWAWAVLSAKYGLLRPDDPATDYDVTLSGAPLARRAAWADRVVAQLTAQGWADSAVRLEIHAGKDYAFPLGDLLRARGVVVDEPLTGLGTGFRRRFYKRDREQRGSRGVVRRGHTDPTDRWIQNMIVAYEAGRAAASALRIGDVFQGASPDADAAGFPSSSDHRINSLHRRFVDGYLEVLEARGGTETTLDGRIVRFGKE